MVDALEGQAAEDLFEVLLGGDFEVFFVSFSVVEAQALEGSGQLLDVLLCRHSSMITVHVY